MATSLLRIPLSLNPNLNPKFHFLNPSRSRHLHRLRLPSRGRLALRPVAAVEIRSPTDEPKPAPQPSPSILLDVTGMMCGACAARVRSALASDPRVDSAVVNVLTDTAAVKLRSGDGEEADSVAEELAGKLTALGFPTERRRLGCGVGENLKKWKEMKERKEDLLNRGRNRVAFAWTLVALCCGSHASHLLHSIGIHVAHGPFWEMLHNSYVKCGIAMVSLFGPGRGNRYLARNGAKIRQIEASLHPVSAYPSTRIDTALFIRYSLSSVFIHIKTMSRRQFRPSGAEAPRKGRPPDC